MNIRMYTTLVTLTALVLAAPTSAIAGGEATASEAKAKAESASTASSASKEVDSILTKYRKAKAVKAKVKKKVVQELMGTENESEGEFYFSKGKLRLDMQTPERSLLVYDGKTLWMESRLDEETVQVTKIPSVGLKKTDSLLAALFDRKDVMKNFVLLEAKDESGSKIYSFKPKDTKKTEVRFLEFALKDSEIERITYKDSMENLISFAFTDLTRGSVPSSKFSYTPPKDASVTVINN